MPPPLSWLPRAASPGTVWQCLLHQSLFRWVATKEGFECEGSQCLPAKPWLWFWLWLQLPVLHAGLMHSWMALCLLHTTGRTKLSSPALPTERVWLLLSKCRLLMHKVTPHACFPIKATLIARGHRIPDPFSVAQALDRLNVDPRAMGPEEVARLLLTHAWWSLVPLEVKRT